MSKMGQYAMELQEQGLDFDESLYDYHHMLWLEEQENYRMTDDEEKAYQLYMEGKLCGQQAKDALSNTNTNSLIGQKTSGEKDTQKYRKPRSRK